MSFDQDMDIQNTSGFLSIGQQNSTYIQTNILQTEVSQTNTNKQQAQARFYASKDGIYDSLHEIEPSDQLIPQVQPQIEPVSKKSELAQKFTAKVFKLLRTQNRDIRRMPRVGRKELDLYKLFMVVQKHGGYKNIKSWKNIGVELNLPQSVTNSGYIVRTKYESFILPFEEQLQEEFYSQGRSKKQQENNQQDQQEQDQQSGKWITTQNQQNVQQLQYQYQQFMNMLKNQVMQQQQQQQQQSQQHQCRLMNINITDKMLQKLLSKNQNITDLELSSLKSITQVPTFPQTLKRVKLYDVPEDLVQDIIEQLSDLQLEEMNIEVYKSKSSGKEMTKQNKINDFNTIQKDQKQQLISGMINTKQDESGINQGSFQLQSKFIIHFKISDLQKLEQLVQRLETCVKQLENGQQNQKQNQQVEKVHPITQEIIENCDKLLKMKQLSIDAKHPQVIIDKIQNLYDNYVKFAKIAAMPFQYKKPPQEVLVQLIKVLSVQGPLPPLDFSDYGKSIENTASLMQVFFANNIDIFFEEYTGIVEFSSNKIRRHGNKEWPQLLTQFMKQLQSIYTSYYGAKVMWKGQEDYDPSKQQEQQKKEEPKQQEQKVEQKQPQKVEQKSKEKQPVCQYDDVNKIYKIEYYNGAKEPIVIKDISIMTTIELFNCQDITVIVEKKCKLIQMMKCKKIRIQTESIISDINYLYCDQCKSYIKGNVGSANVENSSDIQIQFEQDPECVDFNLYASHDIKVYYKDDEFALPDHYICKIKDKKVQLEVVDSCAD